MNVHRDNIRHQAELRKNRGEGARAGQKNEGLPGASYK